jgi:hypothetical protein
MFLRTHNDKKQYNLFVINLLNIYLVVRFIHLQYTFYVFFIKI